MFQKAGFPSEEVYEPCGNLMMWQCAALPPCSAKINYVDRGFRFDINPTTQEAQPFKYVQDRREAKTSDNIEVRYEGDEELAYLAGLPFAALENRLSKDEKAKRLERRLNSATVIPVTHVLQIAAADGAPADRFINFPVQEKPLKLEPFTFDVPCCNDARRLRSTADDEATTTGGPSSQQALRSVMPPLRCSHNHQHIRGVDFGYAESEMGRFLLMDRRKFEDEREMLYSAMTGQSKFFGHVDHNTQNFRKNNVRFNISLMITTDDVNVNPEYRSTVNEALNYSERQGQLGQFWFSNVAAEETHIEPSLKLHDRVRIYFPVANDKNSQDGEDDEEVDANEFSGSTLLPASTPKHQPPEPQAPPLPLLRLPQSGVVSVVCETILPAQAPTASKNNSRQQPAATEIAPSPTTYTSHTWQLLGKVNAITKPMSTTTGPATTSSTTTTFQTQQQRNNAANNSNADDDHLEYILENRKRYVVKFGVSDAAPDKIRYLELEIPCEDIQPENATHPASPLSRVSELAEAPESPEKKSAILSQLRKDDPNAPPRPPVPKPNHVLCAGCHGTARPFVLMNRPGASKDEGFCQQFLSQRTRAYKAWEKSAFDAMKQDSSKGIVILELGCDRKTDVARNYSERTFKQLKNSKCTFVRMAPYSLDTKKGGAGGGKEAPPNFITMETSVTNGLALVDKYLTEKMRKKM